MGATALRYRQWRSGRGADGDDSSQSSPRMLALQYQGGHACQGKWPKAESIFRREAPRPTSLHLTCCCRTNGRAATLGSSRRIVGPVGGEKGLGNKGQQSLGDRVDRPQRQATATGAGKAAPVTAGCARRRATDSSESKCGPRCSDGEGGRKSTAECVGRPQSPNTRSFPGFLRRSLS